MRNDFYAVLSKIEDYIEDNLIEKPKKSKEFYSDYMPMSFKIESHEDLVREIEQARKKSFSEKPSNEILACPSPARYKREKSFSTLLFELIDKKGLSDVECYKKACIDRRLFAKMRNYYYQPSKRTVFALILALKLNLKEAKALLSIAGYTLTRWDERDLAIKYCIINEIYDVMLVNEYLESLNLPLLITK